MRPYACYPKSRFVPMNRGFVYPQANYTNPASEKNTPAANIRRTENAFLIELAVPGIAKDQIKLHVEDGLLTIKAETSPDEAKSTFTRREFNYQNFKRTFRLPKTSNTDAIEATYHQGVLTIQIPDQEKTVQSINIQ